MTYFTSVRRVRTAAALIAACTCVGAAAAPIDYHFDFSQPGSLGSDARVHFFNAVNADIIDANFDVIGQHWIADTDPATPALTLESMSLYGYNGSATAGVTGLQALYQPVLVQFSAPFSLASVALQQDDSAFGFTGFSSMIFLDANGQQIGAAINYLQNATSLINGGPLSGQISAILLSSGKFYRSLDVTAASVPEPGTTSLMLAGLGLIGYAARRRRRGN